MTATAGIRGLVLFGVILGLVAVAMSAWVAIDPAPLPGDVWLMRRIQDVGGTRRAAEIINALGSWRLVPLAVAAGLGLWTASHHGQARPSRLILVFVVAAALTFWSELLKEIVRSPRPSTAYGVDVDYVRGSYGFPSGHVYGDVVVYGLMAVLAPLYLPRALVAPVRAVLVAVVVLSGPARVVVGAHWPGDTVGGYLWGGAVLCLMVSVERGLQGRARSA